MRALIIVDMQNDFLAGGSLAVPNANKILPIINQLQQNYPLIVATQDWHPSNHQGFAAEHPNRAPFDEVMLHGIAQTLWPIHCVQGTGGAQLSNQLVQDKIAAIFRKGMHPTVDSYSAFFDNAQRYNTGLASYLKGLSVTAVDVCGLVAEYCVYYTAKDALSLGFEARILSNATTTLNSQHFEKVAAEFIAAGGIIQASTD